VPRRAAAYVGLVVLTIATAVLVVLYFNDSSATERRLTLPNDTSYSLIVAETTAQQEKGLGDRDDLPLDTAMLFLGETEQRRCFWMQHMRFAIDIVWVDADRTVTAIEPDVAPNTYPKTYCANGQSVIEFNAGETVKNDLKVGQQLAF